MCIKGKFISKSVEETEKIAEEAAKKLQRGGIILLHGNLGAGKTVFARGFARGLGVTEPVSSPTYTIAQEYDLPTKGRFCHLDLYRISDYRAALAFGVDEILDAPDNYTLIEWPERIKELWPKRAIHLTITQIDENTRELEFSDNE